MKRKSSPPIFWVAKRLQSNESFRQAIRPEKHGLGDLSEDALRHFRLSRDEFDSAVNIDEFRSRWLSFLRPNDHLALFHKSSLRLLRQVDADFVPTTVLRSIRVPNMVNYRTLDELVEGEQLPVSLPHAVDRATERLENAVAYVMHLHRITLAPMS